MEAHDHPRRYADGTPRRYYRTVEVDSEAEAAREKAAFLVEVHEGEPLENKDDRDLTINQAVERYLEEHLRGELGREERTIRGYRQVHEQWFAPEIGERRLRDIDYETMVRIFGKMRRAGPATPVSNDGAMPHRQIAASIGSTESLPGTGKSAIAVQMPSGSGRPRDRVVSSPSPGPT